MILKFVLVLLLAQDPVPKFAFIATFKTSEACEKALDSAANDLNMMPSEKKKMTCLAIAQEEFL